MERIELGASGLKVSRICLGTMTFGEQNTEAQAHAQLDYALERGINFIDTAEMYPVQPRAGTYGATEKIIGTWLKRRPRDTVILATNVAGPSRGMGWIRDGKLDATNIRAAIETSLRRLGTDYIDLHQIHWPGRNAPMFGQNVFDPAKERPSAPVEELLGAFDQLARAGKVRAFGVSNETAWGVCEFAKVAERDGLPRIASIQNACHPMNRSVEQGLDEVCFRENVSLLAYSPLAFGQLTAKYVDDPRARGRPNLFPKTWSPRYVRPATYEGARRYRDLARTSGLSPVTLALACCYSRWFVASTILGATSVEQLRENIDAYSTRLRDDVVSAIDRIHAELSNPPQ
ncbi:MAG TPA: aldo/keto reductase [Burkholderiaceae bacterium]|nr:aldo/keto reductase [Burkholderiaceae bacterium]